MWFVPEHFKVKIGGNTYIDQPVLIGHKGKPFVTVKRHTDNGYLGIYFDILDAKGTKLATVQRNEIYPAAATKDDYQIDGSLDRMVLSEKQTGTIICDIKKRDAAGDCELDISVRLYTPSGFLFDATPTHTNAGGNVFTGMVLRANAGAGFNVP